MRQRLKGSIINLVSDLVEQPIVPYHDYATAKSALVGFSRHLAAELGPLGIRVNCVAPGLVVPTDSSRATREAVQSSIAAQTPLRRLATPEDVAGPVLFLASEWSRFVTGQTLLVDGGLVMR
jgi:3-oxoacyl-[acyl-carrier protein] reductase